MLLILFALFPFLGTGNALANCTSPWLGLYGNSCYFFSTELLSWSEARIACIMQGGHLVTIDNASEQRALQARMSTKLKYRNFFTGGTDFGTEGSWRWDATGKPFVYKNWLPKQPGGKYNENCMYVGVSSHYYWADLTCDLSEFYICEKSV